MTAEPKSKCGANRSVTTPQTGGRKRSHAHPRSGRFEETAINRDLEAALALHRINLLVRANYRSLTRMVDKHDQKLAILGKSLAKIEAQSDEAQTRIENTIALIHGRQEQQSTALENMTVEMQAISYKLQRIESAITPIQSWHEERFTTLQEVIAKLQMQQEHQTSLIQTQIARMHAQSVETQGRIERKMELIQSRQDQQIAALNKTIDELHTISDESQRRTENAIVQIQERQDTQFDLLQEAFIRMQSLSAEAQLRMKSAETRMLRQAEALESIDTLWKSASLPLRLQFLRNILPAEHPAQPVLKEAVELEDLHSRTADLRNWINRHPIPFADAMNLIRSPLPPGAGAVEILAADVLRAVRQGLAVTLDALGLQWIEATPGEPLTEKHEVVGEECAPVETGTVARMLRPGFSWQGVLHLPIKVIRAVDPTSPSLTSPPNQTSDVARVSASPISVLQSAPTFPSTEPVAFPNEAHAAVSYPSQTQQESGNAFEWLRSLQKQSMGEMTPLAAQVMDSLTALVSLTEHHISSAESIEQRLRASLKILLPLLPPRDVAAMPDLPPAWSATFMRNREALLLWLKNALMVEMISPTFGKPFLAECMQISEVRKTTHRERDQTVAKVDSSGLRWQDAVLFPALVQRYEWNEKA